MVGMKPCPLPTRPRHAGARPGEDEVVARLSAALTRASGPAPAGETWIGDDAAVLGPPAGPLVLATAAVAAAHADLALVGPDDLGWKALAATLSDLAAMGARSQGHALVSVCGPPDTDLDRLVAGVAGASAEWACPVVGGDLSGAPVLVVVVATAGSVEPGGPPPVRRSGATPATTSS